ncbi:hypothetical protein [Clostridium sp. M14]|nr:hypothetical protein [Clostridium sp. M14]MBZ9693387.1 hypothetical protein [Clostridium sp. M14]
MKTKKKKTKSNNYITVQNAIIIITLLNGICTLVNTILTTILLLIKNNII